MSADDYFPQGLAVGRAFLGRAQDIESLCQNIDMGHHTLLLAPRRYGKTSLVVNTLSTLKYPYVHIDLHLALTSHSVEKKILKCAQELMKLVVSKPEQLFKMVRNFFTKHQKKWMLGIKGVAGVELIPEKSEDDVPENILTVLDLLEDLLKKKEQKAVMFIDEIQELEKLADGQQIAGAIRHFAQKPKRHLIFIFSGSNRRMLLQMFDDRTAPLYELCERMTLGRLKSEVYERYLHKVSEKTWGAKLNGEVFERIVTITECHPKRMYNLCYYLWRNYMDKKLPASETCVNTIWKNFVKAQARNIRFLLSNLSASKIKVLTLVALGKGRHLTGQAAIKALGISGSAITKAIQLLEESDYLEKLPDGSYQVLDPLVRDVLAFYDNENVDL